MADRPKRRKLKVILIQRDPGDSTAIIPEIIEAAQADDIEVRIHTPGLEPNSITVPDEQLETIARAKADKALKARDRRHRQAAKTPTKRPRKRSPAQAKASFRSWIGKKLQAGYAVYVKALPTIKGTADAIKAIGDVASKFFP